MQMNRIAAAVSLAASLAASAAMAGEALACSILPPPMPPQLVMIPNEPQAEYEARAKLHMDGFQALQQVKKRNETHERQTGLWTNAAAVALVEVKAIDRAVPMQNGIGTGSRADVKVVSWLKGKGKARSLTLQQTAYTSCGPMPLWDVFGGAPKERFVVFFETGAASQDDVREAMAVFQIADPLVIQALAQRVK